MPTEKEIYITQGLSLFLFISNIFFITWGGSDTYLKVLISYVLLMVIVIIESVLKHARDKEQRQKEINQLQV